MAELDQNLAVALARMHAALMVLKIARETDRPNLEVAAAVDISVGSQTLMDLVSTDNAPPEDAQAIVYESYLRELEAVLPGISTFRYRPVE